MTRLGPLTSQALGRSPYDIVVQGEGEDNPRAPRQHYDERGRPVNAETKRINRDIVRSHNEVMQVIGVAEPESGLLSADAETNRRLLQQHHEDQMGQAFWAPLRTAGVVGLWTLRPLYQRVLLFRRFDDSLPWQSYRQNYSMPAMFGNVLAGVPVATMEQLLTLIWLNRGYAWCNRWKHIPYAFVRAHLRAYTWLQRVSIAPWLPSPLFFIPFSSESPISRPPPLPQTISWPSMLQWAGQAFLCLAPMALVAAYIECYDRLHHRIDHQLFDALDPPSNPPLRRPVWLYSPFTAERQLAGVPPAENPNPPPTPQPRAAYDRDQTRDRARERERRPSNPPPPTENEQLFSDPDHSQRNAMEEPAAGTELEGVAIGAEPGRSEPVVAGPSRSSGDQEAHDDHNDHDHHDENDENHNQDDEHTHHSYFRSGTPAPGSPVSARRRNTVSSGGGDDGYISEEEEFELSATLISFDVEAADAGDQPSNAWSAELRQSSTTAAYDGDTTGPYSRARARGTYIRGVYYPDANVSFESDTMLSRLPATVYSNCTAALLTTIGLIDLEALALRTLAWTYRMRHGQPVGDLHALYWVPAWTAGLSVNGLNHLLLAFLVQGFFDSACIATALGLGYVYHGSRHGWSFYRVVKEKLWPSKKKGKDRSSFLV